jgi:hypothetical protein
MTFVRKKDKQAQMMVAELSPPRSLENIQLNLKQKINTKGTDITGCSLLPSNIRHITADYITNRSITQI